MRLRPSARSHARVPVAEVISRPARLANERTFLAWLNAALGLLLVGLAAWSTGSRAISHDGRRIADVCVVAALSVALMALVRWWACKRAMATSARLPHGIGYAALALGALMLALLVGFGGLR